MTTVVKMLFGSHLYGLNTPDSDHDYKGIFLPELDDLLLGKVPKSINHTTGNDHSRNGADDVDDEKYSLAYFVELALKGETVAIDMLHSAEVIETSPEWEFLVQNRERFYTKNLKAYLGYIRRQVAKYSVKGSRLAALRTVIALLSKAEPATRLCDIWDRLPVGEHLSKETPKDDRFGSRLFYVVNGKKFQNTVQVQKVLEPLVASEKEFGGRAKLAADNKNIDWKAVSHALRAGYQLRAIYLNGGFTYPLAETDFIKATKAGVLDFKTEVQPVLEALMDEVGRLADASDYPDSPDRDFWEAWLLDVYRSRYQI